MRRHLHRCQPSIVPSLLVVALVAMAPLRLMCRHLCQCYHCDCLPHDNGIVVIVNALVSLLSLSWHCCPCNMALPPLICDSVVSLVVMASLPSLSWRCCPCCNGVFIIIDAQASLPSSQWHCYPCWDGILAVDAQVSSPFLHWQLSP